MDFHASMPTNALTKQSKVLPGWWKLVTRPHTMRTRIRAQSSAAFQTPVDRVRPKAHVPKWLQGIQIRPRLKVWGLSS